MPLAMSSPNIDFSAASSSNVERLRIELFGEFDYLLFLNGVAVRFEHVATLEVFEVSSHTDWYSTGHKVTAGAPPVDDTRSEARDEKRVPAFKKEFTRFETIQYNISCHTTPQSLPVDYFAGACETYASRPVATVDGETMTYGEAWRRGGQLARAFSERGFEKGDRIGVVMSNQLDYFAASLACARGGFVNVPMNDMLTEDEFAYMFRDSSAQGAIVGASFVDTIAEIQSEAADLEVVVAVDDDPPDGQLSLESVLAEGSTGDPALDVSVEPDDLFRLSYTGGTTGKPEGRDTRTALSRWTCWPTSSRLRSATARRCSLRRRFHTQPGTSTWAAR